jgi:hypothetical protein
MQSRKEMVKVPEQGSSKLSMRLLTFGFVSTLLGVLTIGTASEECHPLQLKSKVLYLFSVRAKLVLTPSPPDP